jgi:hypothetical protein
LDTAEDVDGRAARTDGDVQAGNVEAEKALDETSDSRVDVVRVLNVLAALRRRGRALRGGAGAATREGGNGRSESEGGDDDLGEHGMRVCWCERGMCGLAELGRCGRGDLSL